MGMAKIIGIVVSIAYTVACLLVVFIVVLKAISKEE